MTLPDAIQEAMALQREADEAQRHVDGLKNQKTLCWIAMAFGLVLLPFGGVGAIPLAGAAFWLWNIHKSEPEMRSRAENYGSWPPTAVPE